jgi:hypothetical protein
MMCEGGRCQQRGGYACKGESFPGHCPLHDMRRTKNTANSGAQKSKMRTIDPLPFPLTEAPTASKRS